MKTERLQIRVTPELKEMLQAMADEDGRSVSSFVEKLVKDEWKRIKKDA